MTPYQDVLGADDSTALARRIRRGDPRAEASLVQHYCDCVYAMALARTRDCDAACELMDDVLMAVIVALRRGAVRDCSHLGGFVHGTALNTINGYMRRRRLGPKTVALHDDMPLPDSHDDIDALDRRRSALNAMALLDPQDREILRLSLGDGLGPGEIAGRLGLSPVVVRQRKCRALRAIVLYVHGGPATVKARRMLRR